MTTNSNKSSIIQNKFLKDNSIAYILAGGQSMRFNGDPKGLQTLGNQSIISHCISRLNAQFSQIYINSHLKEYEQLSLPIVADHPTRQLQGPLAGLFSCMQHQTEHHPQAEWLFICPCDSPFLPLDLRQRMDRALKLLKKASSERFSTEKLKNEILAISFSYQGVLQPTFSLWHLRLFEQLKMAVTLKKWGGLKIFLNSINDKTAIIEYPEQSFDPFFNINSQQDLTIAEQHLHNLT